MAIIIGSAYIVMKIFNAIVNKFVLSLILKGSENLKGSCVEAIASLLATVAVVAFI